MTEIHFKGKEFVYNHHLSVPHRPLIPDANKSVGEVALDGNLIIQGDNLHALKSLLPLYAGKVDCIFIDPPYNTGNEGWSYNDKVNAPQIQEWLNDNPITIEDSLRHDKWCAMMWPRLRLLHELLADTGSFWMTLDDGEAHRAKLLLDEIFQDENIIANIVWNSTKSVTNSALISEAHTHLLVYAKSKAYFVTNRSEFRLNESGEGFSNPNDDPRGPWKADPFQVGGFRANQQYEIVNPKTGEKYRPNPGGSWKNDLAKFEQLVSEDRIVFGVSGEAGPQRKRFLDEAQKRGRVTTTLWTDTSTTTGATRHLKEIFDGQSPFPTPKPKELLERVVQLGMPSDGLILDSFAGSGTTAHAALEANKKDGGNRRFILVEMEDKISNAVTAERVRRVISGYPYTGNAKTELHRKKLNATALKKGAELTAQIDSFKALEGGDYEKVVVAVKDNDLIITGETKIKKQMPGLGGSFTYCTLGDALDLDNILTGGLPDYRALGEVLFYIATNQVLKIDKMEPSEFYLGETDAAHVWMIYKPDLIWLKSPDAALTLSRCKEFVKKNKGKEHIVLAAANFVGRTILAQEKLLQIRYVPLPYALYQSAQG